MIKIHDKHHAVIALNRSVDDSAEHLAYMTYKDLNKDDWMGSLWSHCIDHNGVYTLSECIKIEMK